MILNLTLTPTNVHHYKIPSDYGPWMLFGLIFMVSNFYRLDLRNGTCIALANL